MTVKLFKNSKVDGITRIGNWTSKSSQISYFDTLTSKTYSVPTVKFGAPLRINDTIGNLLQYGYGYIDYGDGFRYYFTVADLEMVTETITNISYTIDVYDTAKCQTNMSIKRATISRYPTNVGKMVNPYNPDYTKSTKIRDNFTPNIIALYRNSTDNTVWTLVVNAYTSYDVITTGKWLPDNYSGTDIISAGIVADSWTDTELTNYGFTKDTSSTWCTLWKYAGIPAYFNAHNPFKNATDYTISNDGITSYTLRDLRNNIVFECPYNRKLKCNTAIVDISASSISLRYKLVTTGESSVSIYETVIPSEIPTVIADSWNEYYLRQRSIDIETRNLQMNQQLVSGIASSATGAVGGAVGGSLAGIGAGMGAVAGVATGVVSALGNYAVSAYYSPKQQAIIDKSYKNANDTICMVGGASSYIFFNFDNGGLYKEEWDPTVKQAYTNDITNNGYYVNYATSDFDSMIVNGPIQATVEVQGDIPIVWKEQITSRFANGVYLV